MDDVATGAPSKSLVVLGAICAALGCVYGALNLRPSSIALLLLLVTPPIAVARWIRADARMRRIVAVTDAGMFLYMFLPFTIVWYAFRSRGRKGWALCLGLYVAGLAGVFGVFAGALILATLEVAFHHAG